MQDLEAPNYDDDIYSWSLDQAARLRELQREFGSHTRGFDFENLIDEVEDVGGQVRRDLTGNMGQAIVNLCTIAYTPPSESKENDMRLVLSWLSEITNFRINMLRAINEGPGLKGKLESLCQDEWKQNRILVMEKAKEVGGLSKGEAYKLILERFDKETQPTPSEILGFDLKFHQQRSGKDLLDYCKVDPEAPRFPPFVKKVLDRLEIDADL